MSRIDFSGGVRFSSFPVDKMMNGPIARLATSAALFFIGPSAASRHHQDDVLSIEQLRALASERPALINSLLISTDVFQEPLPGAEHGHISQLSRSILVDAATGRFVMDRSMEIAGAEQAGPQWVTLAFDGEIQSAFLPEQLIGILKQNADVNQRVESGIWGVMLLGEPQPNGLGIDDGSLESLLAHGILRAELEFVLDAPCHFIDAYYEGVHYATVWLDVERGLTPLKRVGYGRDGAVSSAVTVDSMCFLEDEQLWLPASWETEIHTRGGTLRSHTVIDSESIVINLPFADEDFSPRFPAGTVVTDQVAGLVYTVSESGDIAKILFERVNDEWLSASPPIAAESASPDEAPDPALVLDSLNELIDFALARRTSEQPKQVALPPPQPRGRRRKLRWPLSLLCVAPRTRLVQQLRNRPRGRRLSSSRNRSWRQRCPTLECLCAGRIPSGHGYGLLH